MLKKGKIFFGLVCLGAAICILASLVLVVRGPTKNQPESKHAFPSGVETVEAAVRNLPPPSQLLATSKIYSQPILKGIKINPADPFKIEFIIDTEDKKDITEEELSTLIKYFLAALTIPEQNLWVNLSPYEKDRVIPDNLSLTDLGKDLLGEDYILKQLVSSLTYPESDLGKKYWKKIFEEVYQLVGTTNIPINTFNKVWIIPESAEIYENGNVALITEAKLKAMHEEDYLALKKNESEVNQDLTEKINKVSSDVLKEIILPEIEWDINHGENFTKLRQMYNSLILATWFKQKLKDSIYRYYIDQGKTKGIDLEDPIAKEKVYNLYVQSFKKGVYDYIKTTYEPSLRKNIKRRYYSGGIIPTMGLSRGVLRTTKSSSALRGLKNFFIGVSIVLSFLPSPANAKAPPQTQKSQNQKLYSSESVENKLEILLAKLRKLSIREYHLLLSLAPQEAKHILETKNFQEFKSIIESIMSKKGRKLPSAHPQYIFRLLAQSNTLERKKLEKLREALYYLMNNHSWVFRFVIANTNRLIFDPEYEGIGWAAGGATNYGAGLIEGSYMDKKMTAVLLAHEAIHNFLPKVELPAAGAVGESIAIHFTDLIADKKGNSLYDTPRLPDESRNRSHWGSWQDHYYSGEILGNIIPELSKPPVLPEELTEIIRQREAVKEKMRLLKSQGSSALRDNSNVSLDNATGGIDLNPAELNMKNTSSSLQFNLPIETIQQIQISPGLTFKILRMQQGIKIESIVDFKKEELLHLP